MSRLRLRASTRRGGRDEPIALLHSDPGLTAVVGIAGPLTSGHTTITFERERWILEHVEQLVRIDSREDSGRNAPLPDRGTARVMDHFATGSAGALAGCADRWAA